MPTADIAGNQRKILESSVRPVRAAHGGSGIVVRDGRTLPFSVSRFWSAPEGYYVEQWFLVHPETREVLYEGPAKETLMWGLQAPTEVRDEVHEQVKLAPGTYKIVFALGGVMGGEAEVAVSEPSSEEAA